MRYLKPALGGLLALVLIVVGIRMEQANANHAPGTYAQGAGFGNLLGLERGYAYVGYGAMNGTYQSAAKTAVADWQNVTQANKSEDALRLAPGASDVQIEVVQTGYASIFDDEFGNHTCEWERVNYGKTGSYAWANALNLNKDMVNDSNSNGWWDLAELTKPFAIARACINTVNFTGNNKGTIGHELGHAMGLNHPIYNGGACTNNGYNTIMAYNYSAWQAFWPTPGLQPTSADVVGPWVCNVSYAGGTNWVYDFSNSNSKPAAAYFVSVSNPGSKVLRACFFDQSSVESNYFLKAWYIPGGGAEGGFVASVGGSNQSACRDWTVVGGRYYHVEMYSYSNASGQFGIPADQMSNAPAFWIYIP